jgi:hypothetical protein
MRKGCGGSWGSASWGGYGLAPPKRIMFMGGHSQCSELCRCGKCDYVCLVCRNRREGDALRLRNAVLAP